MSKNKPAAPAGGISRRQVVKSILAAPLAALSPGLALADDYPSRAIRLAVPFPAGGSSDILARTAAVGLGELLGQAVIVENRPGAGGNIAAEYVARAPKDGYTLLLAGQAIMAINQSLYGHLIYDPAAFEYIGMLGDNANVILSNPEVVPAKNIAELVALAKEQPGRISFGSNGIGSLSHLTAALFAYTAGVSFLHVPYKGAAPMATDLLGGRIGFCVTGSTLAVQLASKGTLRALAVTTPTRVPQLPDSPTLVEAGYPTLDVPSWWSLVTTPGTPEPVMAKLRQACQAVTTKPAYLAALEKQSTFPFQVAPDKATAFMAAERARWAAAVKSSGATATD
jgi:tripartite-type tricarboxylate transporter receptor subunit TctC